MSPLREVEVVALEIVEARWPRGVVARALGMSDAITTTKREVADLIAAALRAERGMAEEGYRRDVHLEEFHNAIHGRQPARWCRLCYP